jgi:ATP-dependent helicase HrpB
VLSRLPIDDVLPALVGAVRDRGVAVLVAPPGAGKTTRVPGALLDAGIVDGEIVVLQPRRLAARMAAARVASERKVALGAEVGYEVRFDRKVSGATRIRFVTEGVLTRRLLADPELRGVGAVLIDEFHERHLDADLALALVERLRVKRPELKLVVMSATLDAEPVAGFLANAPIVRSEGRVFPVTIEHEEQLDDRQLGKRVASAVRRLAQGENGQKLDGDILVFLPGSGEIRRVADDIAEAASIHDLAVMPLHGDLTADEQDAAVRPNARRKVILATNVAETSVTIDGVVAVIDSGLARIARHSPWTGLASLQVEPVSKASCIQRAGRAGRTRPGRVVRLFTKHDYEMRRAFEVPEVERTDLAGAALELYGAGLAGLHALRWYEPPPGNAVDQAETLLGRLGAIAGTSSERRITPLGERMLRFPIHPRLARLVCEAENRGVAREACVIAAAVGARELRLERRGPAGQARISSPSDLLDDLDALERARSDGMRADRLRREGLDIGTAHQVDKVAQQLERTVEKRGTTKHRRARANDLTLDEADRELMICILTAFPDRVGKRRTPKSAEIVFAGGGSGTLAPSSAVIEAELMVAVDVAETGARGQQTKVQIRRASAIEPSWLLDLFLDRIDEKDELVWDAKKERVERVAQMTYDGLPIDESRDVEGARRAGRAAAEVLAKQAIAAGIQKFVDPDELAQWRARVTLAAKLSGKAELAAPDDEGLARVIANAADGAISFSELRNANLLSLLDAGLGEHRALVHRLAPTHVQLGRRRTAITYSLDQPPWIASRMQDFFGLPRAPSVGDGKVPLVVHLLAPNQRAVQVTSDLPGFWVKHYPELRKQLMRRYPRHQWPEDPTQLIKDDD